MKITSPLHNEEIARMVEAAAGELEGQRLENAELLRFRLSLEEILLFYQEQLGSEQLCTLRITRKQHDLTVTIQVPGPAENALEGSPILNRLTEGWENAPKWENRGGGNRITYAFRMENSLRDLIGFIWKYTRPQKNWLITAVTTQWIGVGISIIAPLIIGSLLVQISSQTTERILYMALALMGVRAVAAAVNMICNKAYNIVYNRTLTGLEKDLVHGALGITTRCIDQKGAGLFIRRLTTDTAQLATGFNTMADMITQMVEVVGTLTALLILSREAFCVFLLILLIQSRIENIRTRRRKKDDARFRNASEKYTGTVNEMIRGARDVKLTDSENAFEQELGRRIQETNEKRLRMITRSNFFIMLRGEIGAAGIFAYVAVLGLLMTQGRITPETAIILFNYYSSINASSIQLIGQLMEFIKELGLSADRVVSLLRSGEFPKDRFGDRHVENIRGEVAFDRVWFTYDPKNLPQRPRWVLKEMSFHVSAGERVALVGASGCGKSTAFNLISKLYDCDQGTVRLDGMNIQELDRESIRGNIAVVTQQPYIFQMTIRDNLRLAKENLTEEEMRAACRMACIDEDIMRMREGYDTMIGENGANLSGGQRQRLAIARAILKDSRILLLDEATSALDNYTQARLMDALENMQGNRTILMIAHRLSTVISADRILFMDEGRIIDQGTHAELLERCEPYRNLYQMETRNEQSA